MSHSRTANPSKPNDQSKLQAIPTTTHGQPNDPNDMANPTMAIQQRPTGQLLPNQRRPIHQRRPTRNEASGKILRGLPSHHSSALSPLYATPTCPIAAIVDIGIGDGYDCSVATSEAVNMPNANGSSSTTITCRNT